MPEAREREADRQPHQHQLGRRIAVDGLGRRVLGAGRQEGGCRNVSIQLLPPSACGTPM